jgi:hypothetical protein
MTPPAVIDWDAIGQLLWAAPLAGIAVSITYSLMIVGYARADEARRPDGAGPGKAMAYTLLALVSTAAFLAVVVYGVVVIVKK